MSRHAAHGKHCQNCGTALAGPFCWQCGQHDVDYNRSFGHIVEDGLEGALHFDGKFFTSTRLLFTRPGFLTKEFVAGRRTRYTHPLRFYIFASFLYFAVGVFLKDPPKAARPAENGAAAEATPAAGAATVPEDPMGSSKIIWLRQILHPKSGPINREALGREIWHLTPTMLFLCMPLLAAVLKLVYLRGGLLYIEHLIFALHVMAFVFLAMLLTDLVQAGARHFGDGPESLAGLILFVLSTWVVFRSFRTVYGQGRLKTWLKMALVGLAYGFILIVGIVGVTMASYLIVARES